MRSLLLATLIALGACASASAEVKSAPMAGPADAMIAKTYRVTIDCGGETKPGGTAVDLGGGYLATAGHVIEGDELCSFVLDQDGSPRKVVSLAHRKHAEVDLGILYAPELDTNHGAELCERPLGSTLFAVGYPRGPDDRIQRLTVTRGVLATEATWDDGQARIDAPIFFGNSGGGAWAEDGCLVGITVSGYMELDGWYFIVPSGRVKDLV